MHLSRTDTHSSMEKAWIELEGIEAIVKTASKAKFFIDFNSSCLEGTVPHKKDILHKAIMWPNDKDSFVSFFAETRRSSENDSQSCNVPGFLKLGWSFKQLPKVKEARLEMVEMIVSFLSQILKWVLGICLCPS